MSGKITFRKPSSRIFWGEFRPLRSETVKAMESALGRQLTASEIEDAVRVTESARFWRGQAMRRADTESVRATLTALSRISDDEIVAAFERADVTSRAHIMDGLFIYSGLDHAADWASPLVLRAAAIAALSHFPVTRRGPRITWRRGLAANAARLWRDWGGDASSPSVNSGSGYQSRLVRFAVAMFSEVEPRSPSAVAKLLRDEGAGEISDTVRRTMKP